MKKVFLLLLVFIFIFNGFAFADVGDTVDERVTWVKSIIPEGYIKPTDENIRFFIDSYIGPNYYLVVLNRCKNYGDGDTSCRSIIFGVPMGEYIWFEGTTYGSLTMYYSGDDVSDVAILRNSPGHCVGSGNTYVVLDRWLGSYSSVSEIALVPDDNLSISILSPRNEFKDNVPVWNVAVEYYAVLQDGELPKDVLSLSFTGGLPGGYKEVTRHVITNVSGNLYRGDLNASIEMAPGENNIEVSIKYVSGLNEYYASDSRVYYFFSGVVDEDGDGIDDRTGRPIYEVPDDIPSSFPTIPPESGIFGYIYWFFQSLVWLFGQVSTSLRRMFLFVGDFFTIIGEFFSFLPSEFLYMMILGILLSIVLRIFGR